MKRFDFILIITLLHIGSYAWAAPFDKKVNEGKRVESRKEFHRTYPLSKNALLEINNQYGNVRVVTWNNRNIQVDVVISANGKTKTESDEIIEKINIKERKETGRITLRTDLGFDETENYSYSHEGDLRIDYHVSLPPGTPLNVVNRIGDIFLPDMTGDIHAELSYGSMKAGRLSGKNVFINCNYGGVTEIASVKQANISVKYGNLRLRQADNVLLNIGYGGISSVKYIKDSAKLNLEFAGQVEIGVAKGFSLIDVKSTNSEIKLTTEEDAAFTYDVWLRNGKFRKKQATLLSETTRGTKPPTVYHAGYFIQKSNKSRLKIDGTYSSVTIP